MTGNCQLTLTDLPLKMTSCRSRDWSKNLKTFLLFLAVIEFIITLSKQRTLFAQSLFCKHQMKEIYNKNSYTNLFKLNIEKNTGVCFALSTSHPRGQCKFCWRQKLQAFSITCFYVLQLFFLNQPKKSYKSFEFQLH